MSESSMKRPTRRAFLKEAVALTGVMPLVPRLAQGLGLVLVASPAAAANAPSVASASPYRFLNRNEAAFTETMVNVLCPADELTPNGVTCGLATYIDRELAGDFGPHGRVAWNRRNARSDSPLPLTEEQCFKAGIIAADTACQQRFGVRFHQLGTADAAAFLREIAAGRVVDTNVPLACWLHRLVYPLILQASVTGSIYEMYSSKVSWKLTGYVGTDLLSPSRA